MSPAIRFSTGFTIYFYRGFHFALILGSKFHANTLTGSSQTGDKNTHVPRCSMYGICAYIYHKSKPNVGVYIYYIYVYTPYMKHIWYTPTQTLQDISLSARILATFPDYVSAAQRVEDHLDPPDKKIQSLR